MNLAARSTGPDGLPLTGKTCKSFFKDFLGFASVTENFAAESDTTSVVSSYWMPTSRFASGVGLQWDYQAEFDRVINGKTYVASLAHHTFPVHLNIEYQTGAQSMCVGTVGFSFGADAANSYNPVYTLGFKIYL